MVNRKVSEAEFGKVFANTGKIIKENLKVFVIASVILGIIYSFLYGMWRLPFADFGFTRMSKIGVIDLVYFFAITIMSGIMITLVKYRIGNSPRASKLGGIGAIFAGFVAAACPVCQGITIAALGSTAAFIPLGGLASFVWALQLVALFVLWISIYLSSVSVYTKTCIACETKPHIKSDKNTEGHPHLLDNNKFFVAIAIVSVLVIANQAMLPSTGLVTGSSGSGGAAVISPAEGFDYGSKLTLKPMPLATGEQPKIAGYKTKVKSIPTISELDMIPSTGDVTQDLINNIVPKGTPWYGEEAGVSFDDPVSALDLWSRAKSIKLSPEQEARWNRISGSFTCDFCCGSPQQPTIITRCGCAHSQAAQGIAKWFIQNYGDKYSDDEIYGEMARWFAAWYPGTMVQRLVLEMSASG